MADSRLVSGPIARVHIQSIGEDTVPADGLKILGGPIERVHIQSIEPGTEFPAADHTHDTVPDHTHTTFGDDTNYAEFGADGTLTLHGDATVYDDLQVNVALARVPAVSAPEWTTWNFGIGGGVAFAVLGFGINEYLDFMIQTTHSMQLNTILNNHIHWSVPTNDAGKKIKFQLDIVAAGHDQAFAKPAGSPFTAEYTLGASELGIHRVLDIANVPAANPTVSTIYVCRMKRIAASSADYGSDVYMLFNDSHIIKDSLGSAQEYIK